MPRLVFIDADDWTVAYIDGRKALEGHSISRHTLLRKLGIEFIELPVDQEWLDVEQGCEFPDKLQDVRIGND